MANSSLQGYSWDLPEELLSHLNRIFTAYRGDKTQQGYQRLRNLVDNKKVSYEELKRIKNFFDTFEGKKNDTTFMLNGGMKMRHWVETTLGSARSDIKNPKQLKKDIGMTNQFQKDRVNHTRDGITTNSVKVHSTKELKEQKDINKDIYIKKEMDLMESLINIFDKNKQLWHTDK